MFENIKQGGQGGQGGRVLTLQQKLGWAAPTLELAHKKCTQFNLPPRSSAHFELTCNVFFGGQTKKTGLVKSPQ
jgi:hypothetical protein